MITENVPWDLFKLGWDRPTNAASYYCSLEYITYPLPQCIAYSD